MSRVLGVDHGSKRVGIAISDALGLTARPLEVVPVDEAIGRIIELVEEHQVAEIVVGLPISLSGRDTKSTRDARAFAEAVEAAAAIPTHLVDERLTTRIAEATLIETGVKASRRSESVDKHAAAVLLQGYLEGNSASRSAVELPGDS